ncbi:MAG: DNA repair protein RadC [Caldilineaceae bacterium]|nr:DNA repair protein RadC [Caldilineaceae bacterium]
MDNGFETLNDLEYLSLMLSITEVSYDAEKIAENLLDIFSNIGDIFSAPKKLLCEIPGVCEETAFKLNCFGHAAERKLRSQIVSKPVLGNWRALTEYFHASMAYRGQEHLRVLFLNKRNVLIRDELLQTGTVDHTPVYPREIMRRALELCATAIILVHNHPSGDPTPSRQDIDMTRTVVSIANSLGIEVHDHVVVGRHGHVSFKALRLL